MNSFINLKIYLNKTTKHNEYYESRLATEATELYQKYDFRGACKRAGAIMDVNE